MRIGDHAHTQIAHTESIARSSDPRREHCRCTAPTRHDERMLKHEVSIELPHSAARIWAILQDYDHWTDWSEMVHRVDVLWPGDEYQNGRLRRVFYKLPDGPTGASLELVTDVEPE